MLTPEQAKHILPFMQAIADEKRVQRREYSSDDFSDYCGVFPGYPDGAWEWRIKPEPKTIKYRVGLFGTEDAQHWAAMVQSEDVGSAVEKSVFFQRWLTDWIEVEV